MALILRRVAVTLGLLLATAILFQSVTGPYPLEHWLFLRYAAYWAAPLVWAAGCLSAGHVAVRALLGRTLPLLEQLAVAFAAGVFLFELLLFVLGLLGLYGPGAFFALPLVFLAGGALPFGRYVRRALRHARARGLSRPELRPLAVVAVFYGLLCLVALYLPVMTPINSSFDSRWRHMMIAEQYVVHGGIRRFQEGWLFGASPQFTPLLYAWAFMAPASKLFDHVELSAHLEYVVFVVTTLTGLPALVRRLAPRANPWLAWTARFVFPGVMLYDSNLSVGADHIGAVFAAPLFLIALRAFRGMTPRLGLTLGALIAAAACAKETTALLLVPAPVLTVMLRFVLDLGGLLRARAAALSRLWGSVLAGATTVVLSAPHWLKNVIWYGDPLYPTLHEHFAARPSSPDTMYAFDWGLRAVLWSPTRDLAGLDETLHALFTFSFKPLAWRVFHKDFPVFGSLFTLLLLILPLVSKARRSWALVAWVHLSLFAWYWVHHEERHLQVLVPWMAAVVAAVATFVWRETGASGRLALAGLIGLQVVWGSDVYFYPTHTMVGAAPIKAVAELLGKGYSGQYEMRFRYQPDQQQLGAALPRRAVLLVHERRDSLGIGRTVVTDFYGEQGALDYTRLVTPERVYARLRKLGITHLAWSAQRSQGYAPLAGDIAFFEFAHRYATQQKRVAGYFVAAMPSRPPQPITPGPIVVLGCGIEYPNGFYRLADLSVPRFGPKRAFFPSPRAAVGDESSWIDNARAVAIDYGCARPTTSKLSTRFELVARRTTLWGRGHEIWLPRPQ